MQRHSLGDTTPTVVRNAALEACIAGAIVFGLFILLIGFKIDQNVRNELIVTHRWAALAVVVGLATVGRFIVSAYLWPGLARRAAKYGTEENSRDGSWVFSTRSLVSAAAVIMVSLVSDAAGPATVPESVTAILSVFRALAVIYMLACLFHRLHGHLGGQFKYLCVVALLVYPVIVLLSFGLQGSVKWIDNFGIQVLIYVLLAWGLNIVVGLAGLLDLGYVAFYAIGAYSYALLGTEYGLSFWVLLPVAGLLAAISGVVLGFPVLRLRGDYLAIVTLAFGEIIRLLLINWRELTNGSSGILGIPKVTFFGVFDFDISSPDYIARVFDLPQSSIYYKVFLYYLVLALALFAAFITVRLRRMPIGRAWEALREDEIACRSLGINTRNTKLTAFAIGAMFAGFAGSFFAARQGFISPESFIFMESAIILSIVVLGGMGSLIGIAVAALVMIGGTEILREMHFLKVVLGDDFTPELYRMLLFGIAIIFVMVWKPRGLVGEREPTAFLNAQKSVAAHFTKEGQG